MRALLAILFLMGLGLLLCVPARSVPHGAGYRNAPTLRVEEQSVEAAGGVMLVPHVFRSPESVRAAQRRAHSPNLVSY